MCGINAIINFNKKIKNKKQSVEEMNLEIKHRGPDSDGVYVSKNENVILGAVRLSIVDVDISNQPIIRKENGIEYVIIFNGQIYNYKNLVKDLKEYNFNKKSDTEVLLYSYIKWGEKCLEKINGDFSFVIYNSSKEELFFARDRFGIRPFFYAFNNNELLISSEVKGILKTNLIKKEVNFEAIREFLLGNFTFTSGSSPLNQSFFKNIFQLEAGHYGIFSKTEFKIRKYYKFSLDFNEKNTKKENIKKIKEKLNSAIKKRIPGEVKYATFLSGGIDSSIVTLVAKDYDNKRITSYGINYKDNMSNDDNKIAMKLSKENNINFINPEIKNKEILSYVDDMVRALDSPYGGIHQLGLFSIYKKAREDGNKVVLLGEGADEFNLGYFYSHSGFGKDLNNFNSEEKFSKLLRMRQKKVNYFLKKKNDKNDDKIINRYLKEYYCIKDENNNDNNILNNIRKLYIKKFLTYRLEANDRCGMYNSIEGRVPFCDHEFTEVALRISTKQQLEKGMEKIMLRKTYNDKLPEYVLHRQKSSTPKNKDLILHEIVLNNIICSIKNNDSVWDKILDSDNIEKIVNEMKNKIEMFKRHNSSFKEFTSNLMFSDEFSYRMKHLFAVYTIMRWHYIYFIK